MAGNRHQVRPTNLAEPPDSRAMLLRQTHIPPHSPNTESYPRPHSRASTLLRTLPISTVGACSQAKKRLKKSARRDVIPAHPPNRNLPLDTAPNHADGLSTGSLGYSPNRIWPSS